MRIVLELVPCLRQLSRFGPFVRLSVDTKTSKICIGRTSSSLDLATE